MESDTFLLAKLGTLSGDDVPEWIQYMPPGTHTIRPTESSTGNVVERTVNVEASAADALNRSLDENRIKTGDLPFIDFNHDDKEAAGFVKAFRWAGDDPKTGGIQAQIEWTEPGRTAVKGKAYRRFSPSFRVDENGRVTGAPVNAGGLVNRAAFQKISALWSKGQGNNGKDNSMDIETLKAKVSTLEGENQTLKAKLAQANQDEVLKAKDAQILQHQTEVQTLKAKLAELEENTKKQRATDLVNAAVKDGRIPPKDTVLQAKWVETLTSSPAAEELLAKLSPVSGVPGTVITGQAGRSGNAQAGESTFMAKAKELSLKQNIELGQAIGLVAKEDPNGYEEYRQSFKAKV